MKLRMNLSSASIKRTIHSIRRYEQTLDSKLDEFCRKLAELGVSTAISMVPKRTGSLADGIYLERRGNASYLVVSEGDYAAFVEFGTGVVAERAGGYPGKLPSDYKYNEGRTPAAHDELDPTIWYYYDENNKRHMTQGHVAQPYMLNTSEFMQTDIYEIAREVWA